MGGIARSGDGVDHRAPIVELGGVGAGFLDCGDLEVDAFRRPATPDRDKVGGVGPAKGFVAGRFGCACHGLAGCFEECAAARHFYRPPKLEAQVAPLTVRPRIYRSFPAFGLGVSEEPSVFQAKICSGSLPIRQALKICRTKQIHYR